MASTLDDHSFHCSVCLELFTDPVSTPCGHNFCTLCIETYWDSTQVSRCPLCKEVFHKRPELKINVSFKEVVDQFKTASEEPVTAGGEAKAGEVACDVCTGVKLKAVKSCVDCVASYCETHLEPHKATPTLRRHQLVEAVRNLKARMCPKHRKLLEMFCKKDDAFICQICAETDHSRHRVVMAAAATQHRMVQIKRRGREVELMIQDRQKRIEEIDHSRKQTKENAQKEMEASVQVFTSVMESIQETHSALMATIEARHEAEQKKFEDLIRSLRQEIEQLEKKSVELQQLSHIEDHITLLEAFNQTYPLPSTNSWPSIPVNGVDFLGYTRSSLIKAKEFIDLEIKRQSAAELKKVQKFAETMWENFRQRTNNVEVQTPSSGGGAPGSDGLVVVVPEDITIDPDSAGPWLIVSEDGKEVRQSPKKQKVPASPARFTDNTLSVATQGLTSGRHYWEVGVKGKANWMLGLSSGALKRTGPVSPTPENGLWTISLRDGGQYLVNTQTPLAITPPSPPQRVGVFVDYEVHQVAFFDVGAKTHIFTFTQCDFSDRVYPVFDPCVAPEKKEVAPLKIMMVEITK